MGGSTGLAAIVAGLLAASAAISIGELSHTSSVCGPLDQGDALARSPIHHVFFLIQENHAFENYFGDRPGVLGSPPTGSFPLTYGSKAVVAPFPLNGSSTPDLPHDSASEQADLDNGKLDDFVAQASALEAAAPRDAVGYYPQTAIPNYWAYADHYALADRFFSGVLGPTLPNRAFDLAGTSLNWTSDLIPPPGTFNVPTIFDQLQARGVSYAYDYAGDPSFTTPNLFPTLASNPCVLARIVPVTELPQQLSASVAPSVTFIDSSSDPLVSEHPSANVTVGSEWATTVINTILKSPVGGSSVIFLFWDEAGGFWDPVAPPTLDRMGDGFRVPLLVISPWTPSGTVLGAPLDPSALLRFVDDNWGIAPLNDRIGGAPGLTGFFHFTGPATPPLLLPTKVPLDAGNTSFAIGDGGGGVSREMPWPAPERLGWIAAARRT